MKFIAVLPLCAMGFLAAAEEVNFDSAMEKNKTLPVKYDTAVKVAGEHSICITGNGGGVHFTAPFQCEENTEYEFTAYMKGEKLGGGKGKGAMILLNGGKYWLRFTANGDNMDTGSFDWRKIKGKFNTGYFKTVKLTVYLIVRGEGKCWFDHITITKAAR